MTALSAVSVILLLAGAVFCFGANSVATDQLAPELARGDLVVVLKNRLGATSIKPGDVITFRQDRRTFIRRVARVSEKVVWISEQTRDEQPVEKAVPLQTVIDKVICSVPINRQR